MAHIAYLILTDLAAFLTGALVILLLSWAMAFSKAKPTSEDGLTPFEQAVKSTIFYVIVAIVVIPAYLLIDAWFGNPFQR